MCELISIIIVDKRMNIVNLIFNFIEKCTRNEFL